MVSVGIGLDWLGWKAWSECGFSSKNGTDIYKARRGEPVQERWRILTKKVHFKDENYDNKLDIRMDEH